MSISGIIGGLKYLPASLGVKALQKIDPRFKNFFTNAAAYGIDVDRALGFLTDRFESDAQRTYKDQLEKGEAQGTLRPDEMASRSNIANAELPGRILRGTASIATGGLLGGLGGKEKQKEIPQESEQLQHVPGLGQVRAEHEPGIGQLKGEHVPGLGQVKQPHGPPSPREQAIKSYNAKKRTQDQFKEDFEQQYGQNERQVSPDQQVLLQAIQELRRARGL